MGHNVTNADKKDTILTLDGDLLSGDNWKVDSGYEEGVLSDEDVEKKGNPWHDPKTGRFTSGPGGRSGPVTDSYGVVLSDAQRKYFAGSQAVDENGNLMVVHHGTTHEFTEFDTTNSFPLNDMGKGIYLTNNEKDCNVNYGSESGPDLTFKIRLYQEMLQFQGMKMDEAKATAEKMFAVSKPKVMDCYVNIQNPVRIGGTKATFLDYDDGKAKGKLVDFCDAIATTAYKDGFDMKDTEGFIGKVRSKLFESARDGGVAAEDAIKTVKDVATDHRVMIREGLWGDYVTAGPEFVRQAFENMGYDGIIDHSVSNKFGRMEGMDKGTAHYVAFHSNQVKLIDNLNPTDSNDITKGAVFLWATT